MTEPTERQELTEWLTRNKATLAKYDSDEIAILAHQNGFPMQLICDVLSHWVTDRQTHTNLKTRSDWFVSRELDHVNVLKNSWDHLGRYLTSGREFDQ